MRLSLDLPVSSLSLAFSSGPGFYDHTHFFRVLQGYLVQFGITYNHDLTKNLHAIPDDPQKDPKIPFDVGIISFAGSGPNSRTSQLFIAYEPHKGLGVELWETPVGRVIEGMEHVRAFYSYGDMPPWGRGPVQGKIHSGREYIEENFPLTDSFETCQVERLRNGKDAKANDAAVAENHYQQQDKDTQKLSSNLRQAEISSRESHASDVGILGVITIPLAQGIGCVLLLIVVVKLLVPSRKATTKSS
jgi:cyclophilin family peptidyl-prolyl cis-trans isomerase